MEVRSDNVPHPKQRMFQETSANEALFPRHARNHAVMTSPSGDHRGDPGEVMGGTRGQNQIVNGGSI